MNKPFHEGERREGKIDRTALPVSEIEIRFQFLGKQNSLEVLIGQESGE